MRKLLFTLSALMCLHAAKATVYYVNGSMADNTGAGTSWATAKKDVQDAVNLATTAGDEVWVKAGTYMPTLNPNGIAGSLRDRTFYLKTTDIHLYGGFKGTETSASQRNRMTNVTTLSGDLDPSTTNDAYHVIATIARSNACIIDGFTITGGNANVMSSFMVTSPSTTIPRNGGGGNINISGSNPTISNCTFTACTGNQGGGMYCLGITTSIVSNCLFSNNTASGSGGAIYNPGLVSNCTFVNNVAGSGGALSINITSATTQTISSCYFIGNSASGNGNTSGGGAIVSIGNIPISNCTFFGNTEPNASGIGAAMLYRATGTETVTNCIFYGDHTISNSGTTNNEEINVSGTGNLVISYCIIRDYSSTNSAGIIAGPGIVTNYPGYIDTANLAGADGVYGTADDGLRIGCSSFARDAGDPAATTPATDIIGNPYKGTRDLGAFEAVGDPIASNTLPTASTAVAGTQSAGAYHYTDCVNELMSIDASAGTLSGSVIAKVFVQSSAIMYGQPLMRRYYDITPATGAGTATATVKLYFTQADFDDYNTNRGSSYLPLPLNTADAQGYAANLQIYQQHGTSTTGTPGSFTGWAGSGPSNVTITPTSVTYNATAARWEVTIPVTGFSGFFAGTALAPLDVKLQSFGAVKADAHRNRLDWQTTEETPGTIFGIERSGNGATFGSIGTVTGKGIAGTYSYYDDQPLSGINYYRLRMTERDGKSSYSNIAIVRDANGGTVTVTPQPAHNSITITSTDASLYGQTAHVYDIEGREVAHFTLSETHTTDVSNWPSGIYMLRLPAGAVVKIVKE